MEYTIITRNSAGTLAEKVNQHIQDGWKPVGSHQVVEFHRQNRFSGTQFKDTHIESEYSQTMIKE